MTEAKLSLDDTNDAAPAGIEQHESAMGRAAALLEAIGQGDLSTDSSAAYDDDDDDAGDPPPPSPKAKPEPAKAKTTDAEPPAETPPAGSRQERIQRAQEKLRAETQARRATQDIERERQQLAQERQQLQEQLRMLEPFQRAAKDPRAFLELAKEHLPPEELSAALPEMLSEESRQKWRLKSTETAMESRIAEAVKSAITPLQQRLEEMGQERARLQAEQVHAEFRTHVTSNAEETPGFAALVARNPQKARRLADEYAIDLASRGELPQRVADRYSVVAKAIEEDLFAGVERVPASNSAKTSEKRPAAGKANPLGNRVSSERTTIRTDEDDDVIEGDTLEARTRAAERALRGQPLSKVI